MTTYYTYHSDGSVAETQVLRAPFEGYSPPSQALSEKWVAIGHSVDPVGFFLSQRKAAAMSMIPATVGHYGSDVDGQDGANYHGASVAEINADIGMYDNSYGAKVRFDNAMVTQTGLFETRISTEAHRYSDNGDGGNFQYTMPFLDSVKIDLEAIRKYHDLHSFLRNIPISRLRNAWKGPRLDIVEQETEAVFARGVPKKALALFCGHKIVAKFLRTLEREDNVNWTGPAKVQILVMPHKAANHIGFKILLSWMQKACSSEFLGKMRPIIVPEKLFPAISLARTMKILGLHLDAAKVTKVIANNHLKKRPLCINDVRSIWKCLPRDSNYTYRIVNELRQRLWNVPAEIKPKLIKNPAEFTMFINKNQNLRARIESKEENSKFKPSFDTTWCQRLTGEQSVRKSSDHDVTQPTKPTQMLAAEQIPAVTEESANERLAYSRKTLSTTDYSAKKLKKHAGKKNHVEIGVGQQMKMGNSDQPAKTSKVRDQEHDGGHQIQKTDKAHHAKTKRPARRPRDGYSLPPASASLFTFLENSISNTPHAQEKVVQTENELDKHSMLVKEVVPRPSIQKALVLRIIPATKKVVKPSVKQEI